ncbi:MAG: putative 5-dehydro-4-deoxyglucarate dehydratase [Cyclobacteriaceae bacterium]|nr:MAG: putative 5-dehydro-4-deoxyglucarate dehydratase [Cyclobacteriaceae bacterium]
MNLSIENIRTALSNGLLSFPVTDFDQNDQFNPRTFADRVSWFLKHKVSAVFVAGGTGEFFSLSKAEYQQIVSVSNEVIAGNNTPLISSIGRSIPEAIEFGKIAESSGVDALLLMPPYLTDSPQEGIFQYAKKIINNVGLPVVYYNRANGTLKSEYLQRLADECDNLIGLKDGTGQLHELNDTIKSIGDRLVYIGGVPTAEIIAEAYISIGVNTYSSAVFNFVPDLANTFYSNLRSGNKEVITSILKHFFIPFVRLRNRSKGYAVSLIKSGAELIGKGAGDVRSPLQMPTTAETGELKEIIDNSASLVG